MDSDLDSDRGSNIRGMNQGMDSDLDIGSNRTWTLTRTWTWAQT